MSNTISILRNFLYTAAVGTGCFFVTGCENDQKTIDELTKNVVMVDEGTKIESYLSQEGMVRAKLTSPKLLRTLSGDTIYSEFPHTLHVDFYNDSAKVETWLDSKYGKYYENLNKVYLRDSVTVIS